MNKKIVYIVPANSLTEYEEAFLTSLQGIINSKEPRIIIDVDHYLDFLENDVTLKQISFDDCVKLFINEIDYAVLYTLDRQSTEINAAFSYCSATGALAVPHQMEKYLSNSNIVILEDLSELRLNNVEIQRYVFNKFKCRFNKDGLIHQALPNDGKFLITIRDYAISKKWPVIYCGESDEDREFLGEVLSFMNAGIPIYGWTTDEISFVDFISKYGDFIIPMDWSSNHSYFGASSPTKIKRKHIVDEVLPNKHYVCICVSDGDNVQWLERDFAFTSFFSERNAVKRNYPITFTISPALADLNPACLKFIYSQIKNEDFVSGVSGYGYMNPCVFPKKYLENYTEHSNKYFGYCDLNVDVLIDNKINMTDDNMNATLQYFAKQPNIIGSLYQVDPICYRGGEGKIYWSNDKPFVTARFSLWNTALINGEKPEHAPKKLIEDIANKVNKMPIDITSENGYSYINVHPWSVHWWDVDSLVDLFDDHVQILSAETFINVIKKNVVH